VGLVLVLLAHGLLRVVQVVMAAPVERADLMRSRDKLVVMVVAVVVDQEQIVFLLALLAAELVF
jgi:hypothetical protein